MVVENIQIFNHFFTDCTEEKVGKPYIFLNIISSAIQWYSLKINTGMGVCAIFSKVGGGQKLETER